MTANDASPEADVADPERRMLEALRDAVADALRTVPDRPAVFVSRDALPGVHAAGVAR